MADLVLLEFEGVDGSTTFTNDGSTEDTFTAGGTDAQIDTAQYKFGAYSNVRC